MIPIVLVSHNKKETEKFIDQTALEAHIPIFSIFTYAPEPLSISIDQIREIKTIVARSDVKKIVAIFQFDTAKHEAQNALLKTLEEHSDHTTFILIVDSYDALLPTIQSRCQVIRLQGKRQLLKDTFSLKKINSVEEALQQSSLIKKGNHLSALDNLITSLYDDLIHQISQDKKPTRYQLDNLYSAIEVKKDITEFNLQPEFALDQILLELGKNGYYSS